MNKQLYKSGFWSVRVQQQSAMEHMASTVETEAIAQPLTTQEALTQPVVAPAAAVVSMKAPKTKRKPVKKMVNNADAVPAEPASNVLKHVFLMNLHYLDTSLKKFTAIGVFQNRYQGVGILIKAGNTHMFWSYDAFNQLSVHFDKITETLSDPGTGPVVSFPVLRLINGEELRVRKVFGKLYVAARDKERTILLKAEEWFQFIRVLDRIKKHLAELFIQEPEILTFIQRAFEEDDAIPPEGLYTHFVNQLTDEVLYYKKWLV